MSVLIKITPQSDPELNIDLDGEKEQLLLLVKGSDDAIIASLDMEKSSDYPVLKKNMKSLFKGGMRIMMLAYKQINRGWYNKWQEKYHQLKEIGDIERIQEHE